MKADICIIGGGLVGLTAALCFSAQGRTVRLIESMDLKADEPGYLDARSLALSHSSMQIFCALDLWTQLRAHSAPIRHIHVSSAGHFGVTRLDAKALGLNAMGYVVEYHHLLQALLQRVRQDARIELVSPAVFASLTDHGDSVSLQYRSNDAERALEASLVVVADGANSGVRDLLGIQAQTRDFHQHALVANVEVESSASGVAYERFTAKGPMAMLPLLQDRYALVWANSSERTQQLLNLSQQDFFRQLYSQFGYRLGYFKQMGTRQQFPLRLTRAKQLVSGRCVLIGNAANSLHPVAGQGLNLALRDIAALYDQFVDSALDSASVHEKLECFERSRKKDQDSTVRLGNSLVKLFSNDFPVLNHARSGALMALDACPLLKNEFSWLGMGYGKGVTRLMRGTL